MPFFRMPSIERKISATSLGMIPSDGSSSIRSLGRDRVGVSSPAIVLRIVVLPAPLEPTRLTTSPSPTRNDTSWMTVRSL